jgi:hypothetical protein
MIQRAINKNKKRPVAAANGGPVSVIQLANHSLRLGKELPHFAAWDPRLKIREKCEADLLGRTEQVGARAQILQVFYSLTDEILGLSGTLQAVMSQT